jgi:hypothetical protein
MQASNEMLIGSSVHVISHIVAVVYTCEENMTCISDTANLAIDLTTNIAGKLDLTGRRKQFGNAWMDDNSDTSIKRFFIRNELTQNASEASLRRYQHIMLSFLALLHKFLIQSDNRSLLLRSLDILLRLAQNHDNTIIFNRCPDAFLHTILQLICVNNTVIDPLDNIDIPNFSTSTASTSSRKPPAYSGASNHEIMDLEIRDAALEVLQALVLSSTNMQLRVAKVSCCFACRSKMSLTSYSIDAEDDQDIDEDLRFLARQGA